MASASAVKLPAMAVLDCFCWLELHVHVVTLLACHETGKKGETVGNWREVLNII